MSFIVDEVHKKQLNKYKINIETTYISENKLLVRNTNNSKNDDIINGIRIKKDYYLKDKLVHT